ncbi:MAG: M20/M25/M40 family metallo-hydrolase [Salinivenus sp.]
MERRTVPGESVEQVEDEVQSILDDLSTDDPAFDATCEVAFARQPFEADPDGEVAHAVRAAGTDVLGHVPPDAGQTFWTDAALHQAAGTDTVVLGPVGGGLHTTEEWVDLDSVVQLADILARTARQYCA